MSPHRPRRLGCGLFSVLLLMVVAIVAAVAVSSADAASVPVVVAGEVLVAPSAAVTRSYAYDGVGRRATRAETVAGATSRYGYLYDPHGPVSLLLDQVNGVKASYGYTAYGSADSVLTKAAAGFTASSNPFRYTGRRFDSGSGTLDMGARRYSPPAARFLQRDLYTDALADLGLATDPLTGNRYAYTAANPVNYVELDGHRPVDVHESAYSPISQAATQQFIRDQLAQACQGDYCRSGLERAINAADLLTSLPSPAALAKLGVRFGIKQGVKSVGKGVEKNAAQKAAAKAGGVVAEDGTKISGFTGHGIDRVIGDGAKRAGVKPQALLDAIKNPTRITEGVDDLGRPFKVYTGRDARVVVNPKTGRIVSVNPRSGAGASR